MVFFLLEHNKTTISIKCAKCGEISLNADYCPQCDNIININLKRDQKRKEQKVKDSFKSKNAKTKSKLTLFLENVKNHENFFIRHLAQIVYTTWVIVLAIAIGGFLALVFAYIAA